MCQETKIHHPPPRPKPTALVPKSLWLYWELTHDAVAATAEQRGGPAVTHRWPFHTIQYDISVAICETHSEQSSCCCF